MRWEAWVLLALFVFSIAAETSDIGKPRKVLTREVATGVILCELILIWLVLRLGGAL